ncbi:hypothetical protein HDU96_009011 [Phlyctochytrium bullatum]|nr:hypothetical protein HDU96_009011 [Phlyctochytrium bullatum]
MGVPILRVFRMTAIGVEEICPARQISKDIRQQPSSRHRSPIKRGDFAQLLVQPPPLMASHLELLPVEIARGITIHLDLQWLPNLLAASRILRHLFAPADSELLFARSHLLHQFGKVISACETAKDVPFRKLPDVYAVGWLARSWECMVDPADENGIARAMECVVDAFSDFSSTLLLPLMELRHGPHRPVAWMERIVLKALEVVRIKFVQECKVVFNLASLLDSVAVVKVALQRLFPDEMASEGTSTGAPEVVAAADMEWPWRDPLNKVQQGFAWCMALVAEEAAKKGAIQVLDYALQHPLVPVGFSFSRPHRIGSPHEPDPLEFLIDHASWSAHMHVIHYLLGNPLPLAPPPVSRPIRPGSAGSKHGDLEPSYETRVGTESVLLSPENPVAGLIPHKLGYMAPLLNLLKFSDRDPLCAATYLLDQGASPNRHGFLGPLHTAASKRFPGVARLLVERGANVDAVADEWGSPLYLAAQDNNLTCVVELLECGAERDGLNLQWFGIDHIEWTPLKVALFKNNYDVARVLLRAGATLLVRTKDGDEHIDEELRKKLIE